MKKLVLTSGIAVLLFATFCVAQQPEPTLLDLCEKFHRLHSEHCADNQRDGPLFFDEFDLTKLTDQETQVFKQVARELIAELEEKAKRPFPGLTQTQLETAHRRLRKRDFHVDARIRDSDVTAIVAYILNHPPLDPRLISLEYQDKDTVRITTGVIRGPLNGEGQFYNARREKGRWIVRSDGGWIS